MQTLVPRCQAKTAYGGTNARQFWQLQLDLLAHPQRLLVLNAAAIAGHIHNPDVHEASALPTERCRYIDGGSLIAIRTLGITHGPNVCATSFTWQ